MGKMFAFSVIFFALAGCRGGPNARPEPNPFEEVKSIVLIDKTSPILMASTNAKRVREYIEIGLRDRGYLVCNDCKADAAAILVVKKYNTRQDSKRDWVGWGNLTYMEFAQAEWILTISRNGEEILDRDVGDDKAMPIDQLAGLQVQKVLEKMPIRH